MNNTRIASVALVFGLLVIGVRELRDFEASPANDHYEVTFAAGEEFFNTLAEDESGSPLLRSYVNAEVRPPHLEWWLGWGMKECEEIPMPVIEDDEIRAAAELHPPYIKCLIATPAEWGCVEIKVLVNSTFGHIDPVTREVASTSFAKHETEAMLVGVCPDPMPDRVPLATPEPTLAMSLIAGSLYLATTHRRRKVRPHAR